MKSERVAVPCASGAFFYLRRRQNFEVVESAHTFAQDFDFGHMCRRWTVLASSQHVGDVLGCSLKNQFNRGIAAVSDPTGKTHRQRRALNPCAIADALDTALNA